MPSEPFYDPLRSYEENYRRGPFGAFTAPAQPAAAAVASSPRSRFLGLPVALPLGIPAGPLLNANFVRAALQHGFNLPVYKTVRTHAHASHAWPNVLPVQVEGDLLPSAGRLIAGAVYSDPLSITNSFGVPSFDPDVWQPDMAAAAASAGSGQVVIGSFQGTKSENGSVDAYIADFVLGARLVKETGVRVVEVNLSCPNEGTANLLCFDVARTQRIVEAIKTVLGNTPLVIKIAYFPDDEALLHLLRAVGHTADAISAINTISAEVVDARGGQALPGEGRLRSGVCGAAIRWAGLEMTGRLKALRERLGMRFEIVGVGGVTTPADYAAYRKAGADAVMSAAGAMWNPSLAQEIAVQSFRETDSVMARQSAAAPREEPAHAR